MGFRDALERMLSEAEYIVTGKAPAARPEAPGTSMPLTPRTWGFTWNVTAVTDANGNATIVLPSPPHGVTWIGTVLVTGGSAAFGGPLFTAYRGQPGNVGLQLAQWVASSTYGPVALSAMESLTVIVNYSTSGQKVTATWAGIAMHDADAPVTYPAQIAFAGFTPGGLSLQFQHNDVVIATENAVDFKDANGVTWSVTDDPSNTRVLIQASVSATAINAVLANGTTPGCAAVLQAASSGVVPLTVQGAVGQSVDVFDVRNSASALLFGVLPSGKVVTANNTLDDAAGNVLINGSLAFTLHGTLGATYDTFGNPTASASAPGGANWNVVDKSLNAVLRVFTDGTKKISTILNTPDDGTGNSIAAGSVTVGAGDIIRAGSSSGQQLSWTAYTPTIGGTGWALGNGSVSGRWRKLDSKTVAVEINITLGSTTTVGSGALTATLPGALSAANSSFHVGNWFHAGNWQVPSFWQSGVGSASLGVLIPSSNLNQTQVGASSAAATPPGSGDQFWVTAVLEVQ